MVTVLVQFTLPHPVTREEAREMFLGSAPKYREVPGLIRKYYVLSRDGMTAGGVYLWKSQQDAERLFTKDWENTVRARFGAVAQPAMTYFESPVVVDNETHQVISD